MTQDRIRQAFRTQRDFCVQMDAPVTARVCDALAIGLDRSTETGRRTLDWAGEPIADALPLRLVGGLNAVAQSGEDADATQAFAAGTPLARTAELLGGVIARHDASILPWLDGPPQTNEIGRAGPLMLGLMAVTARFGQPLDLLEIGSSAGLNLLIDRFAFDLGGVDVGNFGAAIRIAPEWRGPPPPPAADVRFASIRGVDVAPVDATDPRAAARLRSYVWAERPERLARLDAAIALLRQAPVRLDTGDAADWLAARLAHPRRRGTTLVLMHSVVWQYLGVDRQRRIAAMMQQAGRAADADRPLAWVRMEPDRDLARHEIWVESWPGDGPVRLGFAHAHGAWIDVADPR